MNTDATYVEVIHLSDLHYGECHLFSPEPTGVSKAVQAAGTPTLADKLIEDLTNPNQVDGFLGMPRIVCISGDLTQKATQTEFQQAESLIRRLQETSALGLPTKYDGFFICPGNHDLNWSSEADNFR